MSGARIPTGQHVPLWVSVLEMAEAWGVPPWEIVAHRGGLRWMTRFKFYHEQAVQYQHEEMDKNKPRKK